MDWFSILMGGISAALGGIIGAYFGARFEARVRWLNRPILVIEEDLTSPTPKGDVNKFFSVIFRNKGKTTAKLLDGIVTIRGLDETDLQTPRDWPMAFADITIKSAEWARKMSEGHDEVKEPVRKPKDQDQNAEKKITWDITGIMSRLHPEDDSRSEIFFWNSNMRSLTICGAPGISGKVINLLRLPLEGVIRVQAEDTESVERGFRLFLEDEIPAFALN